MLRTYEIRSNGKRNGHAVVDPVEAYLRDVSIAIRRLSREEIRTAVEMFVDTAEAGRRIYIIGNGGSAATASHMANDLNKQASVPGWPCFRAFALTDNVPLITAWGNDVHYAEVFSRQLANHLEAGDLVVAISTSGESENVLRALETARDMGARSIGLTGCDGGPMRELVDHCIFVPADEIGQQESVHLLLDHVITVAIRAQFGAT